MIPKPKSNKIKYNSNNIIFNTTITIIILGDYISHFNNYKFMKTFMTILIVILTIILGNYLIKNNFETLSRIFSIAFVSIFGYGVYKILEYFEKES